MCLRISSALVLLPLLATCGAPSPPPPGESIECAIGAGADFVALCTMEQGAILAEIVLHHPDGGFRRLRREPANGGLVPLDGAEPLVLEVGEGDVEQFAIGPDRYRIPRTLVEPAAP